MATYDKEMDYDQSATYFKLKERHIYGSSRVGVRNSGIDLLPLPTQNYSMKSVHYSIGSRTYELSNQLPSVLPSAVGNVLSVISDTAKGSHAVNVIPQFSSSTVISEMRADIRVAQDYSPFTSLLSVRTLRLVGVTLDGRNFVVSEGYRYGFNGMEKDDEVKGDNNSYDFGARILDPRIGRWLTIDKVVTPSVSPYVSMANTPIIVLDPYGNRIIIGNWKKEDKEKFVQDLIGITGLNLQIDEFNRLVVVQGDAVRPAAYQGVPISQIAKADLLEMINDCADITVHGTRGKGSYVASIERIPEGDFITVVVDPEESEKFLKSYDENNTQSNRSKKTRNIAGTTAMKFFHEGGHFMKGLQDEWQVGQPIDNGFGDERSSNGLLEQSAASYENTILSEMGLFVRATYSITRGDYKYVQYITETAPDRIQDKLDKFKKKLFKPSNDDFIKIKMTPEQKEQNKGERDYEKNPINN